MKRKFSVLTRIAKYLIVIIALASLIISISIFIIQDSKSNADSINTAASLRMQAYRIIYQTEHEPTTIEHNLQEYKASLYSKNLTNIIDSVLIPQRIKNHYHRIIEQWDIMSGYIQQRDLISYRGKIDNYIQLVDNFVNELQDFIEDKLMIAIIISLIAALSMITTSLYILRYLKLEVIKPLHRLVIASSQIQQGQFNHIPLSTERPNELGILATVFTQMSQELQQLYTSLEDKVNEKTQNLNKLNKSLSSLYHISQKITATVINRKKLEEILNDIIHDQNLYCVELIVFSAEYFDLKAGEKKPTLRWYEREISFSSHKLALLRWQCKENSPDPRLMINIGQMLGRAVYFIHTQKHQQQLALMEERSIIARELHDSLAQELSFLQIQLTLLKHAMQKLEGETKAKSFNIIKEFEQVLRDGYAQLRELLATFRITIQEANLKLALEQVIESLQDRTNATISLTCSLPSQIFTAQQQVHVLQIIREALLNAIKHANATQINIIAYTNKEGEYEFIVTDNGIGISTLQEPEGHYGLNIMYERSNKLKAKLHISRRQEGGTEIRLKLSDNIT
ncbi:nitrate/nitrite two-component system sensor histidine kinase NarQ [Mergibacter septicus]|uniref:nitrate/nitrite two-component system sensor histidine kinase NarQ n=1 Tax=Mergibacter septicus TaxID=221402 RepID=UPI0011795231|nr:nitrate/nitrite two-component system sensor histidine kinase NarQ [Mergibacter septicus]AWX14008.1 nitrate/nitrite two-component system sensor histidine kinase NarQ [Mergibacter septicus]